MKTKEAQVTAGAILRLFLAHWRQSFGRQVKRREQVEKTGVRNKPEVR